VRAFSKEEKRQMNKFSRIAISVVSVVAMGGLAVAGDAKTDAKAGVGVSVDAKAGGAKVDAKAGAKVDAKTDAKVDAKAGAAMDMPKPPQELAEMAKTMTGSWKCKGQSLGMDMKMADMTATMKSKSDINGWWMHDSFDTMMGKMPFHFEAYTTFDASAKTWRRVMVESGGGYSTGTGTMGASKMDWDLATMEPMHNGMGGAGTFKDHIDWSDAKVGVHAWGEMADPKTKAMLKIYDMTCKK
jgi:hypothetical protein